MLGSSRILVADALSLIVLLKLFFLSLGIFFFLYILRGIGLLTFLPGGMITIWLPIALISGITWGILKIRRF